MVSSGWLAVTAGDHVESYQKAQLPTRQCLRGPARSTSYGCRSQREKQALTQRTLWALEQLVHADLWNHNHKERLYIGQGYLRRKQADSYGKAISASPGVRLRRGRSRTHPDGWYPWPNRRSEHKVSAPRCWACTTPHQNSLYQASIWVSLGKTKYFSPSLSNNRITMSENNARWVRKLDKHTQNWWWDGQYWKTLFLQEYSDYATWNSEAPERDLSSQ